MILLTLLNFTTVSYKVMLSTLPYCTRKSINFASVLFASSSDCDQANEILVFVIDVAWSSSIGPGMLFVPILEWVLNDYKFHRVNWKYITSKKNYMCKI